MIGTEQERAALMVAIVEYGDQRQVFGFAAARNDGDRVGLATITADQIFAAIRAMLTPDDAVVRERIRQAVKDGMFVHKDRLKDGSVKEIIDSTADSVWAVLRGEATRDENA